MPPHHREGQTRAPSGGFPRAFLEKTRLVCGVRCAARDLRGDRRRRPRTRGAAVILDGEVGDARQAFLHQTAALLVVRLDGGGVGLENSLAVQRLLARRRRAGAVVVQLVVPRRPAQERGEWPTTRALPSATSRVESTSPGRALPSDERACAETPSGRDARRSHARDLAIPRHRGGSSGRVAVKSAPAPRAAEAKIAVATAHALGRRRNAEPRARAQLVPATAEARSAARPRDVDAAIAADVGAGMSAEVERAEGVVRARCWKIVPIGVRLTMSFQSRKMCK